MEARSRYEERGTGTLPLRDKAAAPGSDGPGGRVRTRRRVSDAFQLNAASRRGRQPHFTINNLTNGKPAWELARCSGFTLMRPRAKTSKDEFYIFHIYIVVVFFFPGSFLKRQNEELVLLNDQDLSAMTGVSYSLRLCWSVQDGGGCGQQQM